MKFKIKQNPIHMIIFLLTIFIFIAMLFIQSANNIYLSCMILLNIINFYLFTDPLIKLLTNH